MSAATGGVIEASATSGRTCSISGGPSTSTSSGRMDARASATERAEPGPWCRIPRTWTSVIGSVRGVEIAAGPVEVLPLRPVADHGLQVLLPDHPVLDGVLNHRPDEAGRHVI